MANLHLKVIFVAVIIVSLVLALVVGISGIYYTLKLKEVTDLQNYDDVKLDTDIKWTEALPYIFTAVGALSLVVTVWGLCGFIVSSKTFLVSYVVCAGVVVLAVLASGALATVGAGKTEEYLKVTISSAFNEAKVKSEARIGFSTLETSYHCCGVAGPQNYPVNGLPKSCCDQGTDCTAYNKRNGCLPVLTKFINHAFYAGAGTCGGLAVLATVSMVLSVVLIKRLDTKEYD